MLTIIVTQLIIVAVSQAIKVTWFIVVTGYVPSGLNYLVTLFVVLAAYLSQIITVTQFVVLTAYLSQIITVTQFVVLAAFQSQTIIFTQFSKVANCTVMDYYIYPVQ